MKLKNCCWWPSVKSTRFKAREPVRKRNHLHFAKLGCIWTYFFQTCYMCSETRQTQIYFVDWNICSATSYRPYVRAISRVPAEPWRKPVMAVNRNDWIMIPRHHITWSTNWINHQNALRVCCSFPPHNKKTTENNELLSLAQRFHWLGLCLVRTVNAPGSWCTALCLESCGMAAGNTI